MAKILAANAGAWQPSEDDFRSALAQLHRKDSVRHAIESAQATVADQSPPHSCADTKARLLARHLLLHVLKKSDNTQAERLLWKREVHLPISKYGKPLTASYRDGHYSVTHVAEWVCCARSPAAPLGVDIATVLPHDSVLFSLFLSEEELVRTEAVPRKQWPLLFALFWTLKECVLKALGLGLSTKLQMCDISLDNIGLENISVVSNAQPGTIHIASKHHMMLSLRGNANQRWSYSCFMLPGDPSHMVSVVLQEEVVDDAMEVLFVSPQTALQD
ncbi:phosphopantetheinyl transferase-like protein [Leishmania guyanensis]